MTAETAGGVVLLEETRQRWTGQQCEVIAVGEREVCEDCDGRGYIMENDEELNCFCDGSGFRSPTQVKEGDWLLVRPRCFVLTDEENVWVCKQSDVLAKLTLA